jgi:hypothetical protein
MSRGAVGFSGPASSVTLGDALRAGFRHAPRDEAGQRVKHRDERLVAVWIPSDPGQEAEHWLVDLGKQTVAFASRAAQEDSDWDIVGSAGAWEQVVSGRLNLSVALRTCQLRYCDGEDSGPLAADVRITILADQLALTTW